VGVGEGRTGEHPQEGRQAGEGLEDGHEEERTQPTANTRRPRGAICSEARGGATVAAGDEGDTSSLEDHPTSPTTPSAKRKRE